MLAILTLCASVLVQLAAAWVAFRLRKDTQNRAWYLVSLAVLLMALRRAVTLTRHLAADAPAPDPWAEAIALAISALMLIGLVSMRPLFRSAAAATRRIHESETHLRSMIDNAEDIITMLDAEGTIVYESPAVERVLGYTPQQRIGTSAFDVVHEDDREGARTVLRRAFSNPGRPQSVRVRMLGVDGKWRTLECTGSVRPTPVSHPVAVVTSRDVTLRARAEATATRFGSILERSLNEIYVFQADTLQFVLVNEGARINLGYDMRELRRMTPLDLKPEFTPERLEQLIAPLRDGSKERIRVHTRHRRKDGTEYPVEAHIQLLDRDSAPVFVAIILDRSEQAGADADRERLELQLRRAQRLESVGTLAGGIAHDFNNILTPILGYLDIARGRVATDDPVARDLEQAMRGANRARELVQRILTFSREVEQDRRPVALRRIVEDTLGLLRVSIPSTIEIKQRMPDDACTVLADTAQLHQVVLNLCTNATHAMARGGVLEVALEPYEVSPALARLHPRLHPGAHARLVVSDTGCGMDPLTLERIFDPFFTTKSGEGGTGLGLAVVHGIIGTYGGEITAESKPGVGTTFTVYLPRIEHAVEVERQAQPPVPRGSAHIFFVEDEDMIRSLGKEMLEALGYRVTTARDGVAALARFHASPAAFDAVLSDQTMPGMTGLELSARLLEMRPELPILLTTGFSEGVTPDSVRRAGVRDLLLKPYRLRDLGVAIHEMLAPAGAPQPSEVLARPTE